jgi:hypothetical protein
MLEGSAQGSAALPCPKTLETPVKAFILGAFLMAAATTAFADDHIFANGIPQSAYDKALELANDGYNLKKIVFVPGGGWIILLNFNGFWAQGIPQDAYDKLLAIQTEGKEIKSIAFSPTRGWIILFDYNGYWYTDVPTTLVSKVVSLANSGKELRDVAIANANRWVVIGNNGSAYWQQVPTDLGAKLNEYNVGGKNLRSIALSPVNDDWVMMHDERAASWKLSNGGDVATEILRVFNEGKTPLSCGFANDGTVAFIW